MGEENQIGERMRYSRNIDDDVMKIAFDFILLCPSSIQKGSQYFPVSKRGSSFRSRGIYDSLLRTMLSQIKKNLPFRDCYAKIGAKASVIDKLKSMEKTSSLNDPNHEYIVICEHSSMTETEAVFYYIRNAFAHGSFSVEDIKGNGRHYYLESDKENTPKARMCLKESTLLKYRDFISMTPKEIEALQRKKRVPAYQ